MKYGIMEYSLSHNLGDEIQSIAARQFMPVQNIEDLCYPDRDKLKYFSYSEPVKMILNGWYTHDAEGWPPSKDIVPLLVSMHISQTPEILRNMFSPESKDFFRRMGPVGTRDLATLELMQKNDIPAYFSGCMTLTLMPFTEIKRRDYILTIDISDQLLSYLKTKTNRPIYNISPEDYYSTFLSQKEKYLMAEILLNLYQNAHCVITKRLHAAMPCLAFETPVLLVNYDKDQYRYSGLNKLVRNTFEEEYLRNYELFNLDYPGDNSDDYLVYRNSLIKTCENFTGSKITSQLSILNNQGITGNIDLALMDIMCNRFHLQEKHYSNLLEKIIDTIKISVKDSMKRKKRRYKNYWYKIRPGN